MMDYLTLDIGGTKTAAAWWQGDKMVRRLEAPTPRTADDIVALIGQWGADGPPMPQVGAAITGTTDGRSVGALNRTLIDDWDGYPLAERLERLFGVPAHLLNDAQAAAWGEYTLRQRVVDDLLFITVSTGLGGGLVLGGQLRTGHTGLAGHLGHVLGTAQAAPGKLACSCGRGVCLERLVSGRALEDAMSELGLGHRSAREWMDGIDADTRAVQGWLDASVERLAQAIADAHTLLELSCVVLGGGLGLHPRFLAGLRLAVDRLPPRFRCLVEPAILGADAGLRGMALWLRRSGGR